VSLSPQDGFLIWLGAPSFKIHGLEYFSGRGGIVFLGVGAAVLGYSQLYEYIYLVNEHADYWISATCEPDEDAWAGGPDATAGLPWQAFFVAPFQGGRPECFTR